MQTYADISNDPWRQLDLWLVSNCVPTYYLTQHWGMKNAPVLLRFLAENRFTKQSGKFGSNLDRVGCSWFLSKNQICRLGHAAPIVFWACNLLQQNGRVSHADSYHLLRKFLPRGGISYLLVNTLDVSWSQTAWSISEAFLVCRFARAPALVICPPWSKFVASAWHHIIVIWYVINDTMVLLYLAVSDSFRFGSFS